MAKNLDEMKGELYEAFNEAMIEGKANVHSDSCWDGRIAAAHALQAAAEAAKAIVAIEREQREAAETKVVRLVGK